MNARTQTAERIDAAQPAVSKGEVAVFQPPRLPWHNAVQERFGVDRGGWKVLVEAIFPNARTVDSVVMALSYCKARNLDIFKRPVNIVPMWNSSIGREVETVWPGINEIQTSAARTGSWAGMDEPRWGPDEKRTFKGRKKTKDGWEAAEATVTFPTWSAVTVYRLIGGQRYAFTEPVYWIEAYSRAGGAKSELPTDMWIKRPHGQLHKVAKAASLRAAFPEEGEYTAEEMEGKEIEAGGVVIEHESRGPVPPPIPSTPSAAPKTPPHDPDTGEIWDDQPAAESPSVAPPPVPQTDAVVEATADDVFDPAQWLKDLDAAFSGCEDMVSLGEEWTRLALPYKDAAFPPDFDKATVAFKKHQKRIAQTIIDAG